MHIPGVEDYESFVGTETVNRILAKGHRLVGEHVVHINSTYYGGGVAELLSPLTLLMNKLEIRSEWRTITGHPDFFSVTKKIHNALQGAEINLTEQKKRIYEDVVNENALRTHLDYDFIDYVFIHDPQPLPMITHYDRKCPWVWRCHLDLSNPNREVWEYLQPFIEKYDAVILSLKAYAQKLKVPQLYFLPAIDPFSLKNRPLADEDIQERLSHYDIPADVPLVVQVSRFDRWKDPEGVIRAFNMARKEVDCRLILIGNVATDDPEGQEVFESLLECQDDDVRILSVQDTALINALQSRAAVVLQKSLREGFGLTVSEAMWKGTPVIGGNVGGIPAQIEDGLNGFVVSSVEEAAARIVQILKDGDLRNRLGAAARETVRRKFLLTRLLEQHLDLMNSFRTRFELDYTGE